MKHLARPVHFPNLPGLFHEADDSSYSLCCLLEIDLRIPVSLLGIFDLTTLCLFARQGATKSAINDSILIPLTQFRTEYEGVVFFYKDLTVFGFIYENRG